MNYDEFLAAVQDRGGYASRHEAETVAQAVLQILATRILPGEAAGLAAQLPGPLAGTVRQAARQQPEPFGVEEFCRWVADQTDGKSGTAEGDASAVLSTLAEAVTGGQLNQLISQLPPGYAPLFGQPGLACPPAVPPRPWRAASPPGNPRHREGCIQRRRGHHRGSSGVR